MLSFCLKFRRLSPLSFMKVHSSTPRKQTRTFNSFRTVRFSTPVWFLALSIRSQNAYSTPNNALSKSSIRIIAVIPKVFRSLRHHGHLRRTGQKLSVLSDVILRFLPTNDYIPPCESSHDIASTCSNSSTFKANVTSIALSCRKTSCTSSVTTSFVFK